MSTRPDARSRSGGERRDRAPAGRERGGSNQDRANRRPPGATPTPRARGVRRRRAWVAALACLLVVGGPLVVSLASPWLDVTRVEVRGAAPETRGEVEQAATVAPETSLLWLDGDPGGDEIAERVRTLPRIAGVEIDRDWPHTLVVTVAEREPVLAVPGPGGAALVDGAGFAYRTIPVAPRGVPTLGLPPGAAPSPTDPATLAAVHVVTSLPADLRRRVLGVTGNGAFDVQLALDGDRVVRWGADADDARKAAVLRALLTRPGSTYDVSSPELAVVR